MKKKMKKTLLVALLLAGAVVFGAKQTRAEVVEAKKGQTYTGEYAVIVNTSQERTESSGTLQFVSRSKSAQAVQEDSPGETSQSILQEETASLYNVQHMPESRVVDAKAGVSYKVGDIRKGIGYPDGTAIEQNYVCIGVGEHCYIWMEMNLMQSYQKQGLLSAIARETAQVYDGEPYTVLDTLCSGSFPAQDGSGKLSILLETLHTSTGVYMYETDITAIHLRTPAAGEYIPGQMARYNGLLVHEGQHALLHLMTGFPAEAKWFTEGLSVATMDYIWGSTDNNQWLSYIKDNGALRNGASLLYSSYRNSTGLDYGIQYLFVRYMIDQMAKGYDPMAVLPNLYRQSASGKNAQQFLTTFTGREFSTFLADFYTAVAACEKDGNYGFYMDAVAENGAALYPRYTGNSGQAVQIEKTGALLIPLNGGSFTVPADCGEDIKIRIVGTATSGTAVALQGKGTAESPYLLHSAAELRYIYKYPGAAYRLETDIRMNGSENFTVPSFSGVLDGNGHTIYGLRRPLTADNTGTIQNLLAEAAFTADCTGMQGILANENHGTITNCHVSGSIRGRLPGVKMSQTLKQDPVVGGIAGRNYQGFCIEKCTSSVTMELTGAMADCRVGGIAGETNGTIDGCTFTGTIRVTQTNGSAYNVYVGGIVGELLRDYGFYGMVKNSRNQGTLNVSGGTKAVGQICGYSTLFLSAEAAAYYLSGCTWDAAKGTSYGTPVSLDTENPKTEEPEISLPAPSITETQLLAVQGQASYLYTGNVTGGSGTYETTVVSEQLPTGIKRTAMPGGYRDCFMYEGTPTGAPGTYTSRYQVRDTVTEKAMVVTVTIELVTVNTAKIYRFALEKEPNSLEKDIEASIDGTGIRLTVPATVSVSALHLAIEYGYTSGSRLTYYDGIAWKEYYTNIEFDFSQPRLFKVTAPDQKTTQVYTVTVIRETASGGETGGNNGGATGNGSGNNGGATGNGSGNNGGTTGNGSGNNGSTVGSGSGNSGGTTGSIGGNSGSTAGNGSGSSGGTTGSGSGTPSASKPHQHRIVADPAVAPTCTTPGKTAGSHCADCKIIIQEQRTISATGHTVVWTDGSEPTFWNEGKTASAYCGVCHVTLQSAQPIARKSGTGNLNMTSFPMRVKQKTTALRVENMAAGDWIVSWTSLNPKVATVNARGMITAKKQGKAWIQVTLASGIVLKAQVKVQKKQVKTTRLSANTGTLRLKAGTKAKLNPTAYPLTTQQKIIYSSKNKKIAAVNGKGWIQAKKQGQTTVTIRSGSKKTRVKVVVYK